MLCYFFFFSSRRRHTRYWHDWSSDVCSSDLKIKAKSPQTNGICERFNRTVQNEFYAIAFRKKIYTTIEQLQTDLDTWMNSYNTERTHSGKYCCGKTPMQTFIEGITVAKKYQLKNQETIKPNEADKTSFACESERIYVTSQMSSDSFL